MIYLFETELVESKPVILELQNIYGIGKSNATYICKQLGICSNLIINELSEDQIANNLFII